MGFVNNIISWFKSTFGITPEKKSERESDSDFEVVDDLSITAALAERITVLATVDSTVEVVGDNMRADYLNKYMQWIVNTKLAAISEICLGTGDCLARPNTNGSRIGIDIIQNKDFIIVESIGDFLLSVLIKCDEIQKGSVVWQRWEYLKLHEEEGKSYVTINQYAFKNGKQVSITDVSAWENLVEMQVIPNVDRLPFGRFKCPKINRYDINSANGVPITFGNEKIVSQVKSSYKRFNEEFENMEAMIFADRRIFKAQKVKKADGTYKEVPVMPKGKERVIQNVNNSSIDGAPLIKEFAPSIRDASMDAGIERNLRMLELFCGFNEGVLSKSTLTYTNTDEVKKSSQATYSFISNLRKVYDQGLEDLMYAVNVICNYNNITPMGDYEIVADWSDSFVESTAERFNQLLQSLNMDTISKAEFRSWVMNESLEVSDEKIAEMNGGEINE